MDPTYCRDLDPRVVARAKVFTTGQVARLCKVAPRTCAKWFDSGRLKGYRIPGSQDRRIPRDELLRFMKENGLPLGPLERVDPDGRPGLLLVGLLTAEREGLRQRLAEEMATTAVEHEFEAGLHLRTDLPAVVVADASLGFSAARRIAAHLLREEAEAGSPCPLLVALVGETDTPDRYTEAGYRFALQAPVDPDALAGIVRRHVAELSY